MTSLFYFIGACGILTAHYQSFVEFVGLIIFAAMLCIASDTHFKPTIGTTIAALIVLWFVPSFYGLVVWLFVSAIDAGVRGVIK